MYACVVVMFVLCTHCPSCLSAVPTIGCLHFEEESHWQGCYASLPTSKGVEEEQGKGRKTRP